MVPVTPVSYSGCLTLITTLVRSSELGAPSLVLAQRLDVQDQRFLAELLLPHVGVVDGAVLALLSFSHTPLHPEVFGRELRVVL